MNEDFRLDEEKIYSLGHSYLIPKLKNIVNESVQNPKYKLNAFHLTCSCKIYRERAKLYPKRDLRRLCKHLFSEILTNYSNELDPLTKLLVETYFWFGRQLLYKINFSKSEVFFCYKKPIERIYIFAHNNNWQRYIYNYIEDYWDSQFNPNNDMTLILKIKKQIELNTKLDLRESFRVTE